MDVIALAQVGSKLVAMINEELGELKHFQRFNPSTSVEEAAAVGENLGKQCRELQQQSTKYGWGIGRLICCMIAMLINPAWNDVRRLCVEYGAWQSKDEEYIKCMKEVHETLMCEGRIAGRKAVVSEYRFLSYMRNLCGRGLFPTKMSLLEEVEMRKVSAIERRYHEIGARSATKQGWYDLVQQSISEICIGVRKSDDMESLTEEEYYRAIFRHTSWSWW